MLLCIGYEVEEVIFFGLVDGLVIVGWVVDIEEFIGYKKLIWVCVVDIGDW